MPPTSRSVDHFHAESVHPAPVQLGWQGLTAEVHSRSELKSCEEAKGCETIALIMVGTFTSTVAGARRSARTVSRPYYARGTRSQSHQRQTGTSREILAYPKNSFGTGRTMSDGCKSSTPCAYHAKLNSGLRAISTQALGARASRGELPDRHIVLCGRRSRQSRRLAAEHRSSKETTLDAPVPHLREG
ncbi:hypothetical protein [Kibdelosporangium philippinense]|uniref:hypothetical protein n=1 Tax=Kibdelosporangium philippinense TaxID=211113 RepID=UPI0036129849